MGLGSYRASDWTRLRSSKGLTQVNRVEKVFTVSSAAGKYDVRNIRVRESRDSDDSPRSTPVIIGFDVTASMGYLAKELAVNAINKTVTDLCRNKPITNPHVMCAAIGDCKSDKSPLQVTQFEADIRIIEQLTSLYLEGGGGGNGGESYNLLWYFAAFHTSADCFEKRNEKGFLFTIGDDDCHAQLTAAEINRVFGDCVKYPLSNEELIREAQRKYNVFHIHIETDSPYSAATFAGWQKLMPGNAAIINKKDIGCISELITAIIGVASGKSANEALKGLDQSAAEKISRSMAFINTKSYNSNTISF